MKYYFILTIIFSVIYYLYLNPAFIHPNFTGRFIIKKLLFSIVLGIDLPFCDPLNEESFLNVISLLFVFIYTSYKLSLDCPNGYAESSLPFLKAFFRLAVFLSVLVSIRKNYGYPSYRLAFFCVYPCLSINLESKFSFKIKVNILSLFSYVLKTLYL